MDLIQMFMSDKLLTKNLLSNASLSKINSEGIELSKSGFYLK